MKTLIKRIKSTYPHLTAKFVLTADSYGTKADIPFANSRYSLWIIEEKGEQGSYVVGIDFLHNHYDSGSIEENRDDAWQYIEAILNDEVVVIGNKKKTENYIIATMSKEEGLKKYSSKNANIEIESFSKSY